jgi:hypothetical protein
MAPETQNNEESAIQNRRSFFLSSSVSFSLSLLLINNKNPVLAQGEMDKYSAPVATFALRRAGSLPPSLTNLPPQKNGFFVRFGEQVLYSNDASRTPGKDVYISFDFPSDWLQLDRIMGGVQYVDQRNGDKLYVLKVSMPDGVDKLKDVPKEYFGDAIFNPMGEFVRIGNPVEEYKVVSSQMLNNSPEESSSTSSSNSSRSVIPSRRRLKVKYTTVTGNNFAVERKGLVDAYEVSGMIYMLMTGSNAVLFDKKGRERETVEYIVDSFYVEPTLEV